MDTSTLRQLLEETSGGNDYLKRMLLRKIKEEESVVRLPVKTPKQKKELLEEIHLKRLSSQEEVIKSTNLNENDSNSAEERIKTTSQWIINSLLEEKLKDRLSKEREQQINKILKILMVLLPLVTNVIQFIINYYLPKNST